MSSDVEPLTVEGKVYNERLRSYQEVQMLIKDQVLIDMIYGPHAAIFSSGQIAWSMGDIDRNRRETKVDTVAWLVEHGECFPVKGDHEYSSVSS